MASPSVFRASLKISGAAAPGNELWPVLALLSTYRGPVFACAGLEATQVRLSVLLASRDREGLPKTASKSWLEIAPDKRYYTYRGKRYSTYVSKAWRQPNRVRAARNKR